MRYIYEIAPWTDTRTVKGTDYDEDATVPWAFLSAEFSSEALGTSNSVNTEVSVLETLVNLFTGGDPMEMLQINAAGCKHDSEYHCDCPSITIDIPATLAYHAQQLNQALEAHDRRFSEFKNNNGSTVRTFPDHTGKIVTCHQTSTGGIVNPAAWEAFEPKEQRARLKILHQWLRTGIMLKQALGHPEKA